MSRAALIDRRAAWRALSRAGGESGVPAAGADVADLPAPAQRLLARVQPTTGPVGPVLLEMEGEIKLNGWMPFTATQVLHPAKGFVWNATVGRPWLRFRGGDAYWQARGSLEFRLFGLIPVVQASGPDVDRSAAGRLAAETVAWAPEALHPAAGVIWTPIDDRRATVSRLIDDVPFDVEVTVDDDGRLQALSMNRWGDPGGGAYGLHPFGGEVTEVETVDGVTVASEGSVGWWWGTDRWSDGEFFRYRLRQRQVGSG